MQTFRCGGPGGQNQNKRDTGVRFIHEPSGATGESREERSQLQNKKIAFGRMARSAKFQVWLALQLRTGPTAEEWVEQQMSPENIKTEIRGTEGWVTV